jgi:hypothetical protein
MHFACTMPRQASRARMRTLRQAVAREDCQSWVEAFLAFSGRGPAQAPGRSLMASSDSISALNAALALSLPGNPVR